LIIYVNGDSHSAAAEANHYACFAKDDPLYQALGRHPHPDNIKVSYSAYVTKSFGAHHLYNNAESASSNDRIIRTTKEYLKNNTPHLIIIGWSTWEREEIKINDQYYQFGVGCLGIRWPTEVKTIYSDWLANINYEQKEYESHEKIWALHKELNDIPHLFFNSYLAFNSTKHFDWNNNYLHPYDNKQTYYNWLKSKGFKTVNPNSYHFGADAHRAWANHLTKIIKESIMAK
jgi:hypothetical protein